MSARVLVTHFAPVQRMPIEVVRRQQAAVAQSPAMAQRLKSVPDYVFILNTQRQIVFASLNVQELLHGKSLDSIIGQRPGEALDCAHAREMEAGCGASVSCQECGAVKAILSGLQGQETASECRLTRLINLTPVAVDLLVRATPFELRGERFVLVSLRDRRPG